MFSAFDVGEVLKDGSFDTPEKLTKRTVPRVNYEVIDHIEGPFFRRADGAQDKMPEYAGVRVVMNGSLSDEKFVWNLRRCLPKIDHAVAEMVAGSEELAKYKLPRSRVHLKKKEFQAEKVAMDYIFTIDEIEIRRVKLVVFSPTGSSLAAAKMIGEVISDGLETLERGAAKREPGDYPAKGELLDLCAGQMGGMGPHTLCIFSVPCYGGRIPQLAAERLSKVCGDGTPAIVCVTFGNRAYEDALVELADIVTENGFRVIAGCAVVTEHNIMHEFGRGRPDAADRTEIRAFAERVLGRIREGKKLYVPSLPGNRPYKNWPGSNLPIIVDESLCSNCGICAKRCPAGAVLTQGWKTDQHLCINCMRCVAECPAKCRRVPEETLRAMTERLRAACEERKENAFFCG